MKNVFNIEAKFDYTMYTDVVKTNNTYYTTIRSLYPLVVCNVSVSCKANGDRNQLWALLDSDSKAD